MKLKSIIILVLLISSLSAQDIKVKFLMGEVRYRPSVQIMSWKGVQMNTQLHEKNIVRTGSKSVCELELPDGSITKILENSMLELRNTDRPETHGIELFASLGKFYFRVKKAVSNSFTVTSPVAVAAIRGTEFLTIHDGNETKILVKTGEVELSDPDKRNSVRIRAGNKASIQSGKMPSDPEPLTSDEQKALNIVSKDSSPEEPLEEDSPEPSNADEIGMIQSSPSGSMNEDKEEETDKGNESSNEPGFRMGAVFGAATIDDEIYSVIGLRPEFSIGKLGVALDLSIYMDKDGNIRKDNWDSARDIFEKLYYVRWGHQGDPFYIKVGAIDNYRLGFGLLMNHYYNTIEYPNVIRTGMELGLQGEKLGFQGMLNNFSELTDGGGLMAGRVSYKLIGNLEVGGSVVFDRNQYKGLKDRDKDGVPDLLDAFPDDRKLAIDTDGDGQADKEDYDRDGDGFTDNREYLIETGMDSNLINDQDYIADPMLWEATVLNQEPFDINAASEKTQIAFAGDISYPLLNFDYLKLITYGQYAKFPHSGGWGITAPGFLAKFAFINLYAEYRIFSAQFLPEYFNTTYELERAVFIKDSSDNLEPHTKRESLARITEDLKGYMVGADFNIFDYIIFGAEYQNMKRGTFEIKTFRSTLDLNTDIVPKISKAGA
ncbi:MAG: FecR family protein, partial [Calditrichaceae bacterium]